MTPPQDDDKDDGRVAAHHPGVLLVLGRIPPAEARVLRLYMDMLMHTVEAFSLRGKAMRAERDALLETLAAVAELTAELMTPSERPERPERPDLEGAEPVQPAALNQAQRQTQALLASLQQAAGRKPAA